MLYPGLTFLFHKQPTRDHSLQALTAVTEDGEPESIFLVLPYLSDGLLFNRKTLLPRLTTT